MIVLLAFGQQLPAHHSVFQLSSGDPLRDKDWVSKKTRGVLLEAKAMVTSAPFRPSALPDDAGGGLLGEV